VAEKAAVPTDGLDGILDELAAAAKVYDRPAVTAACDRLLAEMHDRRKPIDEKTASKALGLLRKMRSFDEMRRLGDALIVSGQDAPPVVRQYAQAIIESGALTAAEAVLLDLAGREALGSKEGNEARGLLGRVYKQMYLVAGGPTAPGAAKRLEAAIGAYHEVYAADPTQVWHGVNAAALLARAKRDGVTVDGPDRADIATALLARIEESDLDGSAAAWDYATAMEAALVLDDGAAARKWLSRYVDSGPDAFALAGTLRQLEEVWQVTADSGFSDLLAVLGSHMMEAGGGQSLVVDHLTPEPAALEQRSGGLEKTFGSAGAVTVEWWSRALERLRSVARIEDQVGTAIGTAFLVTGSDLNPAWGEEPVLVTNAHVASHPPAMRGAVEPDDAMANFTMFEGQEPIAVTELLYQSGPAELDVAVLRPASVPSGVKPVPLAKNLPLADGEQRLYVMGHPLGGDLKISIDDNVLIAHDEVKVHYRAPTEPGSSGSPVFNRNWQLIALHHAGNDHMERLNGEKGTYRANEGISFLAIKAACSAPATG